LNGPPADNDSSVGFGDADMTRQKSQDPYFVPILKWLVRDDNYQKTASISSIQRQFSLGFSRAGKIIDQLAQAGFVSGGNGSKVRNVLATAEDVERLFGEG
jgi:S-DNA-T family DNA segregation ATPase FtsK/SpoIIIE